MSEELFADREGNAVELLGTLRDLREAENNLKRQRELIQVEMMDLPTFKANPLGFGAEYQDLISVRVVTGNIKDFAWNVFTAMKPSKADMVRCVLKLRYSPEIVEASSNADILGSLEWAEDWGVIDLPGAIARKYGLQPDVSYQLAQLRSKRK